MVSHMVSLMVIGSLHFHRSLILKAQESHLVIRKGATHSVVVVPDRECVVECKFLGYATLSDASNYPGWPVSVPVV